MRIAWSRRSGRGADVDATARSGRMPGDLLRVPEYRPARSSRPHRVPGAGPGLQPLPRLRGDAGRRPRGHRERVPAAAEPRCRLDPEELEDAPTLPGQPATRRIQEAEQSELLRRCLGDHLFESLLTSKRIEWERYRSYITDYELNRYLPVL